MMKNIPGPRAPPLRSLPNRKMTTRSYSCTTLMQKNSDRGKVAMTRSSEKAVRKMAQMFVGSPEVAASFQTSSVGDKQRLVI